MITTGSVRGKCWQQAGRIGADAQMPTVSCFGAGAAGAAEAMPAVPVDDRARVGDHRPLASPRAGHHRAEVAEGATVEQRRQAILLVPGQIAGEPSLPAFAGAEEDNFSAECVRGLRRPAGKGCQSRRSSPATRMCSRHSGTRRLLACPAALQPTLRHRGDAPRDRGCIRSRRWRSPSLHRDTAARCRATHRDVMSPRIAITVATTNGARANPPVGTGRCLPKRCLPDILRSGG